MEADQRAHYREAVNYFFARLETIFGKGRFNANYPDKSALNAAKNEWVMDIGKLSREQIDKKLSLCKALMADSDIWPDPGKILSLTATQGASGQAAMSYRPASEVLEALPEQTDETRAVGRACLDGLLDDLTEEISQSRDRSSSSHNAWLERHNQDMQKVIDRYGENYIRMTPNGPQPTDIPVPRELGICDPDFTY